MYRIIVLLYVCLIASTAVAQSTGKRIAEGILGSAAKSARQSVCNTGSPQDLRVSLRIGMAQTLPDSIRKELAAASIKTKGELFLVAKMEPAAGTAAGIVQAVAGFQVQLYVKGEDGRSVRVAPKLEDHEGNRVPQDPATTLRRFRYLVTADKLYLVQRLNSERLNRAYPQGFFATATPESLGLVEAAGCEPVINPNAFVDSEAIEVAKANADQAPLPPAAEDAKVHEGTGFSVSYPANWEVAAVGEGLVMIAHREGLSPAGLGYGLLAGYAPAPGKGQDLEKANKELMKRYQKQEKGVVLGKARAERIGGVVGLRNLLRTPSPLPGGGYELVTVYTALTANGLWQIALVCPESQEERGNAVLRRIAGSVVLK